MMKSDLLTEEPLETLSYASQPSVRETPAVEPPPATWLRVLVSCLLILVILAFGGGVAIVLIKTRPQAAQTPTIIPPTLVETRLVQAKDVRQVFVGYGTARADKSVVVSAEVGGLLVEVPERIEDGTHVEKGDLLARIDDRTYRNHLEQAQSQLADVKAKLDRLDVEKSNVDQLITIAQRELDVNEREYERLADLRERSSASKKEVDFARLAAEQSRRALRTLENQRDLIPSQRAELMAAKKTRELEIEAANLQVERSTILSPMAGQVERINVETGNHVMPGSEIARIVATDQIEVPVELPLSVRSKTRVGEDATLTTEASPDARWHAKVVRLSPMADSQSRTFMAYLEVDNTKQVTPLVPGEFVTAHVEGAIIENALEIPRGAMVEGHVFVAIGHKAQRKKVSVETLIGDQAVVSGELASGDRLIMSNLDILYDGATIRVDADEAVADAAAAGPADSKDETDKDAARASGESAEATE